MGDHGMASFFGGAIHLSIYMNAALCKETQLPGTKGTKRMAQLNTRSPAFRAGHCVMPSKWPSLWVLVSQEMEQSGSEAWASDLLCTNAKWSCVRVGAPWDAPPGWRLQHGLWGPREMGQDGL